MAVASMVCGIVSLLLVCCFWYVALPAGIVGLILGILSIRGGASGKGMAVAGVVTSGITLLLSILVIIGCAAFADQIRNELSNYY